jgi:hypothetical protein
LKREENLLATHYATGAFGKREVLKYIRRRKSGALALARIARARETGKWLRNITTLIKEGMIRFDMLMLKKTSHFGSEIPNGRKRKRNRARD